MPLGLADGLRGETAILARGHSANGIARSGGEEVRTQLKQTSAIDFGELYFQQNFLSAHRPESKHVDHVLGISGGQFSRTLGHIFGGHMAGEHDGCARW